MCVAITTWFRKEEGEEFTEGFQAEFRRLVIMWVVSLVLRQKNIWFTIHTSYDAISGLLLYQLENTIANSLPQQVAKRRVSIELGSGRYFKIKARII